MKGIALDGGGVFGAGQAAIFSQIDRPTLEKFEFLAGTSIGSAIAAGIASGMSGTNMISLFRDYLPNIFAGYWWRKYKIFTPRYPDKVLNEVLRRLFPMRFKHLDRPVFITAVDLNRRTLKVFNSRDSADGEWPTWEIVRAAVAAESYFLPWKGYGDGGVVANNPSMVAVAAAVRALNTSPQELEVLSIGTGEYVENKPIGSTKRWTRVHWGLYVLNSMLNGFTDHMHDYFVRSMPLRRYLRVQFQREKKWDIDDSSKIPLALEKWELPVENAVKLVESF
jgi:patatin-like phospholipase/acyl hydrolase